MKFILSCDEDYKTHSKKWMVGYAFIFWLFSRILVAILMGVCVALYSRFGIDPKELTAFGGDPTVTVASRGLIGALLMVGIIAPVFEELLFRYGLSFRRFAVAVSCACVALFPAFSYSKTAGLAMWLICIGIAIAVFCAVYFLTTDRFWSEKKPRWQIPAIWATTIAFGLAHLMAFSTLTWVLLPYALIICLAPFFAGCSCAYLRVNMGFGWGIAMHIFNNLPGIFLMLLAS